jgi:hypothetical protein
MVGMKLKKRCTGGWRRIWAFTYLEASRIIFLPEGFFDRFALIRSVGSKTADRIESLLSPFGI